MELLAAQLVDIFHSYDNAALCNGISAAEQWARHIHLVFYNAKSSRGSNKFVAIESTLTQVVGSLSTSQSFWDFMVQVLLVLAQEPALHTPTAATDAPPARRTAKKSSKKCQPNAPLAFLVVNALGKLAAGGAGDGQQELCRLEGRRNQELRSFCLRGLGNSSTIDQKLLVGLLELFQITDIDTGLVRKAMDQLLASKSHAALIKLCETFTDVDWPLETIVKKIVHTKDWTSAELLVRTFEAADDTGRWNVAFVQEDICSPLIDSGVEKYDAVLAKVLIDETISLRDFKRAHRFVSNFDLQKEYPDIDVLYSRDGLVRLIETQRWQLALTFVGHDITLQKVLLEHMVAAGELANAAQLIKKMVAEGFEPDVSLMSQAHAASCAGDETLGQHDIEDGGYLSLPLEDQNITFCASEETVRDAMRHFFGPKGFRSSLEVGECVDDSAEAKKAVGLDVEWRPVTSRSKATAVASILQIASSDQVFIFDLLTLHDNDFLFDTFLLRLFTCPQWLKLGFSFDSDLKVLRHTFPERLAFAGVSPFLDLNELRLDPGSLTGAGLSQCVRHVLGKPLDKRMQLSDWEQRPLSQNQLKYAALDALCLVHVVDKVQSHSSSSCGSDVSKHVGRLVDATSLTDAEVTQATTERVEYQKKWLLRCFGDTQSAAPLVTPQDIARMWKEREDSQAHGLDAIVDTSLKFVPMDQITALLEDPQGAAATLDFVAVNSICIFVDDTPFVVCIDACCKLDMAQIARFCGVGRRRVRLATAAECRSVFGFTPGTVAPFGHKAWVPDSGNESAQPLQIKVFADSRLRDAQFLAAGSGSPDEVIWVESQAFFALISVELVDDVSIPRDPSHPLSASASAARSSADYSDATLGGEDPQVLEYRFVADSMVTQVGRWLRTIGVDVVAWNPDEVKVARSRDPKSVMLAFAAKEDRIVLTRDTSLPSRRDAGACFVLSDDECYKQFREVKVQFGLLEQLASRSSRCARCNSDTFSPIAAASARKKMSERLRKKVPASVSKFWACDNCGRVYWEGPKYTPTSAGAEPSPDGRVVYRPVPRKRISGDRHDQRHLPDPLI